MVDFAKLREQNRLKLQAANASPRQPAQEKEEKCEAEEEPEAWTHLTKANEKEVVEHLLELELGGWPQQFLESIYKWMKSSNYTRLSDKQFQKLKEIAEENDIFSEKETYNNSRNPPTRDNRFSDGQCRSHYDNYNQSVMDERRRHEQSEWNDDIPF